MFLSKCVAARVFFSPIFAKRFILCSSFCSIHSALPTTPMAGDFGDFNSKEVALSFKEWFKYREDTLLDRIYEILAPKEDDLASQRASELALSRLGLRLSEAFVLKVLNHGTDVLSCLKFFDWAGRQSGYNHTRATFHAIFKILSRAKLMSLMLDFLGTYTNQMHMYKVRFHDTLVMGYAVAGKPEIALQLFGKMRFQGLDLDAFAYHVLLNALVEGSCFDVVDVISKQITMRGLENEITSCIRVKNLCKQKKLKEAEDFVRGLVSSGCAINDYTVGIIVNELCKNKDFEAASQLLEEFCGLGKVPLAYAYGIWIRNLVQSGKVKTALEFLRSKKFLEGYLPPVFRYNILICKLLRENRLYEVFDLFMEMKKGKIFPDKVTMNAALCFFCKAGMVDVALELYNSRSEFGLSLNSLAYNYLINTLCGDGSVDEAYQVLRDSIKQGYFPGKKTFAILADALCDEGKLDKMNELIIMALEQNFMPSDDVCGKFISALCKAGRVEDGYLIHGELNRLNKRASRYIYFDLIHGFNSSNRADLASRLLIEMQEKGHTPTQMLYRDVICGLFSMDNPKNRFFKLLGMQLSRHEPNCEVFALFIDGAGHARKPELAREVFEMMAKSGLNPNLDTKILMLQSYLKSERIADALNFYGDLCRERKPVRKLYNTMIVGLAKAKKPGLALEAMREGRKEGLIPSLQCYEELVLSFSLNKNYDFVVEVVDELEKTGRRVSSFIGNVLLLHSLIHRKLYQAWVRYRAVSIEPSPSGSLTLGELLGLFSGCIRMNQPIDNFDEVIKQFFPVDLYTYNTMLRRVCIFQTMDDTIELFDKICKKGYQPNRWTYDIIVHGLCKEGRRREAQRWVYEMNQKGFDLTEYTRKRM